MTSTQWTVDQQQLDRAATIKADVPFRIGAVSREFAAHWGNPGPVYWMCKQERCLHGAVRLSLHLGRIQYEDDGDEVVARIPKSLYDLIRGSRHVYVKYLDPHELRPYYRAELVDE